MRLGKRERAMLRALTPSLQARHERVKAEDALRDRYPNWDYQTEHYLKRFHGKPAKRWEFNAKGRPKGKVRVIS